MKKIILLMSLCFLFECHGMQQLARHVMSVTRSGIRASSSQAKIHPCGLGAAIGTATGAVAGGVAFGGACLHDGCKALWDDENKLEGGLLLVLTPFAGIWGAVAGSFVGGAYGATWPVSVPVTVGVIVHSQYKKNKRDYERRMQK